MINRVESTKTVQSDHLNEGAIPATVLLFFLGSITTGGHSQTSSAFINDKRERMMIKLDSWLD